MKFVLISGFLLASLLVEAHSSRIKAQFPPKSANRQSRLILSGTLPSLREVTVCHWINTHGYRPNGMYIVSYAHGEAANELLTGIVHIPVDKASGYSTQYMALVLYIRNNTVELGKVMVNKEFRFLGKWRHLCFTWSSGGGLAESYLDGELIRELIGGSSTPLQAGEEIRGGGILMIGQEQDTYNGQFDPDQAWDGYISDVHIWDEKLTNQQIATLYRCGKQEGNVFAWMRSPVIAEDGVIFSRMNLCDD